MSPRPRSGALHAIAAFTLAAHAGLIGLAWRDAESPKPRPALRVAMRLVATPPAAAPQPAAERPARRTVAIRRPPARVAAPRPAVAPQPEPVAGVALGAPRWGLPGPAPAPWLKPPPPVQMQMQPMLASAQAAQAHASREAAQRQITDALQRALPPAPADDGRCALLPATALACDNEALQQALAPREAALAGLLAAHRSLHPQQAGGLSISVAQGRYTVAWDTSAADQGLIGASVTSTPRDVTVTAPGL